MCSTDCGEVEVAFKALNSAMDAVLELDCIALTTPELFALLRRCQELRRQLPAVEHPLINQIASQSAPIELGGRLSHRLADELRITRGEANRRIHDAADVHDLTRRCGAHHPLIGPDGYTTRRRHNGEIETIPPPHLDHGQPRTNTYHHPEKLLRDSKT